QATAGGSPLNRSGGRGECPLTSRQHYSHSIAAGRGEESRFMSDLWTLEEVDRSGAVQEAAEKGDSNTREAFRRKPGLGAGAVVGGGALMGALPSLASAAGFPAGDIAILNFALTL